MTSINVPRSSRRLGGILLLFALASCQDGDRIPPEGSTISIVATPGTIVLSGGIQATPLTILATVRSGTGLPLPGQDVRFTTTSGVLDPQAGTPVRTDDYGNATTILTEARQQTTVTAQSGKATQSLQINTATCDISTISLDQNSLTFNTCSDSIDLTATVEDTSGDPCVGVLVQFVTTPANPPSTDIILSIVPGSKTTDAAGQVTSTVTLNQADCSSKCVNDDCNTSLQEVKAVAGSVSSQPIPFIDNIP